MSAPNRETGQSTQLFWWLNLIRGIVALIIGILILTWPQTGENLLANFFAVYWLCSGFLGLRWSMSTNQKKGWWLALSLLEIWVGVGILLRPVYAHYLPSGLGTKFFGLIVICVGLARIFGLDLSKDMTPEQSLGLRLLGFFDVTLGLLLIFLNELEPFTKLLFGGCAFLVGIVLILQSLQIRRATLTHP